MATLTYSSNQSDLVFRAHSYDKTRTWDGSAMTLHASVSNYGTDGVLTPSTAASSAGGDAIQYTVTLPTLPISGSATKFWLVPYRTTPTNGGHEPESDWLLFCVDSDQALVDVETLAEAGVGAGLTEEEVEALIAAAIAGARVTGGGGLNPVQSDLTLVVRKGTQYAASNNRAAQWTIADWGGPSLSGLTVTLLLVQTSLHDAGDATADLAVNGTASLVGDDAVFSVDLSATNLDELDAVTPSAPWFNYRYMLRLNLSGGAYHEITSNAATVQPKITAPA